MTVQALGFQSEPCYAALLTLLAATQPLVNGIPTGSPLFVTTGRRALPVSTVVAAQQPALFIMEGEIVFDAVSEMGASVDEYKGALVVFFWNETTSGAASPQMNAIRDAVIFQMRQRTLNSAGSVVPLELGDRQTLGGLCMHAALHGKALSNEGLQNQQGAVVFPVSIFTGV